MISRLLRRVFGKRRREFVPSVVVDTELLASLTSERDR
jgi:hypothetical protein